MATRKKNIDIKVTEEHPQNQIQEQSQNQSKTSERDAAGQRWQSLLGALWEEMRTMWVQMRTEYEKRPTEAPAHAAWALRQAGQGTTGQNTAPLAWGLLGSGLGSRLVARGFSMQEIRDTQILKNPAWQGCLVFPVWNTLETQISQQEKMQKIENFVFVQYDTRLQKPVYTLLWPVIGADRGLLLGDIQEKSSSNQKYILCFDPWMAWVLEQTLHEQSTQQIQQIQQDQQIHAVTWLENNPKEKISAQKKIEKVVGKIREKKSKNMCEIVILVDGSQENALSDMESLVKEALAVIKKQEYAQKIRWTCCVLPHGWQEHLNAEYVFNCLRQRESIVLTALMIGGEKIHGRMTPIEIEEKTEEMLQFLSEYSPLYQPLLWERAFRYVSSRTGYSVETLEKTYRLYAGILTEKWI